MGRTFDEEMSFIERADSVSWRIKKGFVPNMNVSMFITTRQRLINDYY